MKKERIETLVDSFVDINGDTRYFVIAAVSEVLPTLVSDDFEDIEVSHEVMICTEYNSDYVDNVVKKVTLGYAFCNPTDTFNEELGKTIAIGRARKNQEAALYSTKLGYINTKLVKAFLEQEAEYFKNNPENYIKGYKRKK